MRFNHQATRFIALATLLTLIGCSSAPVAEKGAREQVKTDQTSRKEAQDLYSLAAQAPAKQRDQYLLKAASILLQDEKINQAAKTLGTINERNLAHGQLITKIILDGEAALGQQDYPQAITSLNRLSEENLADPQQARQLLSLKIEAYNRYNDPLNESRARIAITPYLATREEQLANQQALMELSLSFSQSFLDSMQAQQAPANGELNSEIDELRSLLRGWANSNTNISLSRQQIPAFEGGLPEKIAVIIPLSGRFSSAGEAVRNGLMSAYYENSPASRPQIAFYDTKGDQETAWEAYLQATNEGADFIIGPLTRGAVGYLALSPELSTPTLALNYAPDNTPTPLKFYQFGLSPEEEASQVAARAWEQGLRQPVILTPDNNWGKRIAEAFNTTWNALGGEARSIQHFPARENDFSSSIRRAMELDLSNNRHKALQQLVGTSLKFEPRRRTDVDFIFIAAQPRQARLLRPQLKFHYAGSLPVFSTSHIFSGKYDPQRDRDMNDIIFGDTPWTLDQQGNHPLRDQILTIWPEAPTKHWRLYALGIDAYRLSSFLSSLPFSLSHYGETGELHLTEDRRIYRLLNWAKFKRGVPKSEI